MKEQLIVVSPDAGRIKEILPKRRFGTGNSFKKDETAENARVALLVAGDLYIAEKSEMKMSDLAEFLFDWLQDKSKKNV